MTPKRLFIFLTALCLFPTVALSQSGETDLDVFGYFQASLYKQEDLLTGNKYNSFTLQQLNLMLQKGLWRRWNAFVNFEFTNSYSSFDNWGSFSLEEAWVRYRHSRYLRLKMGLLIPRFNAMNVIKNRTPLLPYIIRPLVYETSLQQSLPIEEFVPEQAYIQIHGSAPIGGDFKFDYTGYWGNSPNIEADPDNYSDTGLDTTSTFLFGLRVGVRHPNFQIGFSATTDKTNKFVILEEIYDRPPGSFEEVPRYRTGLDLSAEWRSLEFWMEGIAVLYDEDEPDLDIDKSFVYMTVAYTFWEKLLVYFGVMELKSNLTIRDPQTDEIGIAELTTTLPNFGVSFALSDRLKLKAQFAGGETTTSPAGIVEEEFGFFALAASVRF